MKEFLHTILILSIYCFGIVSSADAQNWSEDFEGYANESDADIYGYTWDRFNLINSGAGVINNKTAYSPSVGNPSNPAILTTGYLKLNGSSYNINFNHKANNISSSPVIQVVLVNINNVEVATLFTYTYTGTTLQSSSFNFSGFSGWYHIRFKATGNGGNSRISLDNINSTIAASTVTGSSTTLADIQSSVSIVHNPSTHLVTVTINFVNKGPDDASKFGGNATAHLSNMKGINFSNYTSHPAIDVDTVNKTLIIDAPGNSRWDVNEVFWVSFVMNDNYSNIYQVSANFDGFSNMEDPVSGNNLSTASFSFGSLPVKLEYFVATRQDKYALVSWKVSLAVNFDHFELERSIDGVNYTSLTRMNYSGNTTYRYTDLQPSQSKNYYRLKMVDIDGSARYSEVKMVSFATTDGTIKVYPTLIQKGGTINVVHSLSSGLTISLFDFSGKKVYQTTLNSTGNLIHLPQNLAGGQYVMTMENSSGNRQATKISVQ